MALSLKFRVQSYQHTNIPGDISVVITGFLQDLNAIAFTTAAGTVDTFTVQSAGSSLPDANFANFFIALAQSAVNAKYSLSITGTTADVSDIVAGMTTTNGLFPQMAVTGTNIQLGTSLVSVRDSSSIRLSQVASGTGSTSLQFSPANWDIDYTDIVTLASIVNFGLL